MASDGIAASSLKLDDFHREQVVNYLKFIRLKRAQSLKDVGLTFKEHRSTSLKSATYAKEEVLEIINGLEKSVQSEIESELIHNAHTNVLMLNQLFQQAQEYQLKLAANISQLENKSLLDAVARLESDHFHQQQLLIKNAQGKLRPLNGDSHTLADATKQEIEALRAENEILQRENQILQSKAPTSSTEVERLRQSVRDLELDLNGKLQQSKPVQNLRRLLNKKNEDLRALVARLQQLDPSADVSNLLPAASADE